MQNRSKRSFVVLLVVSLVLAAALPAMAQRGGWGGGGGNSDRHGNGGWGGLFGGDGHNPHPTSGGNSGLDFLQLIPPLINSLDHQNTHHPQHHPQHQDYYYEPRPQYYYPQATSKPKKAPEEPKVEAKPNKVEEVPVDPVKNKALALASRPITPAEVAAWKNQTQQQTNQAIDNLASALPNDLAISNEINSLKGKYTPDQKKQILDAVKKGDAAALNFLLDPADKGSALSSKLQQHAQGFGALLSVRAKANAGTLTPADIQNLKTAMGPYISPGNRPAAQNLLDKIAVNSSLMNLLNTAMPGNNIIPIGGNAPIILVPGLPQGTIIALGNGSVLVGTGGGGQLAIQQGNVAQAMGMSVALGAPVPDSTRKDVNSGTLLMNGGKSEVNYVVNNGQYSMGPGYSQTLPADKTWVVEFDRGGSNGEGKYTVEDGTYKFTPTGSGWELYKHKFNITLDNSKNAFDFHYVFENKPAVIAANSTAELSSKYPIQIRFDDSGGKEKTKRLQGKMYVVALSQDNKLDLFTEEGMVRPPESVASAPGTSAVASLFGGLAATTPSLFGNSGAGSSPSLFNGPNSGGTLSSGSALGGGSSGGW